MEEGLLYRDDQGRWSTAWDGATQDYRELSIAPNVVQSIRLRLARLEPAVRVLLGVAAVIGRQVEFDLWLAACAGEEGVILAAAEKLVRRGLLVEAEDPPGYRFAHEMIRQVVYEELSPVRLRRCHHQVAVALEALHPDQVEVLAQHFYLGQDWSQAVRYAGLAGERAQAVYANRQALENYRRADAWLAQGRVDWPAEEIVRRRAELAEKQGQVHGLVGEYAEANAALTRAWQALEDAGDWCNAVRVLNQLSFLCFIQDDYAGASHYAGLALTALPETDPPADLQAITLTHLGLSAWGQGRYHEAQPPLEQAQALFEGIGSDPHGLARCLNSLGLVHLELGNLYPAGRYFARSLALRQEIGDRRGEAWCWHNHGRVALAQGDLATAREKLETARAIFAEIEHPYGLDTCARFLAEVERAAAAAGESPQHKLVRLPRADAPTGRPLRDDEYVTVRWTLDAPGDHQIQGKVARRRYCLLRLLEQARAQGAIPSYGHLAEALGVSRRTIERDMAHLRQQKHLDVPPTRGTMTE